MGKFAKITLVLGIIVIVASGGLIAFSYLTRSDEIWTVAGNSLASNNSVALEAKLYIVGVDYVFQYVEEHTMNIDVIISNTATSEIRVLNFSISPQSQYVEDITKGDTVEVLGGTYNISYSCLSAEFKASSTDFRIVKPGLFRSTVDPEGTVIAFHDAERTWLMIGQYAFSGIGVGVLILFAAFFIHIATRKPKQDTTSRDAYYQTNTSFQQERTFSDPQYSNPTTSEPQAPAQDAQKNYWTCSYCNTVNDNLTGFCVICNMKKE